MAEIGTFDVLGLLTSYLSSTLNVNVSTEIPDEIPEKFISIYRTGGVRQDIRNDTPQITMRVYARTELEAWELASNVRSSIQKLPALTPDVLSVAESGVRLMNPTMKTHRAYELVFFLTTTI